MLAGGVRVCIDYKVNLNNRLAMHITILNQRMLGPFLSRTVNFHPDVPSTCSQTSGGSPRANPIPDTESSDIGSY